MPPVVSSLLVCGYLFFLHVFFDEVWIHTPRVCTPDLPSAAQHSFILFESQRWNSRVTQAWKIPTVHCTTRLLSCSEHSPLLPFTVFTFQCSVEVSTLAAVWLHSWLQLSNLGVALEPAEGAQSPVCWPGASSLGWLSSGLRTGKLSTFRDCSSREEMVQKEKGDHVKRNHSNSPFLLVLFKLCCYNLESSVTSSPGPGGN